MTPVKLHIRNMVCSRCIMVVENVLESLKITDSKVTLGEVGLKNSLIDTQKQQLQSELLKVGFALIDDKKSMTIERVKNLIIDLIQNKNNNIHMNYSQFLAKELGMDYSYISSLFSSIENITIEKYIILQKIEKVKELMMYDEYSLNQISDLLNYSSVQALSGQFKKITGFSPAYYKKLKENKRKALG